MKSLPRLILMLIAMTVSCEKPSNIKGSPWEIRYVSPSSYDLLDMRFVDSGRGAVLANSGMGTPDFNQRLLYSEDGGRSWTENQFKLDNGHLVAHIHLFDDLSIIGITTDGDVVESRDLGKTWDLKSSLKLQSAKRFVFPYSETHGFITAINSIYRTNDGGVTWQLSYNNADTQIESLLFPSGQGVGYAIGGYTGSFVNKGSLLKTTDGGNSWTALGESFADILSTSFVSNEVGYLFTNDQRLWVTYDGGGKWTVVNDQISIPIRTSLFVSINRGFFADKGSGLWATENGGKSWSIIVSEGEIPPGGSGNTLFCKTEHALYLMINGAIMCSEFYFN